MPRSKRIFCLSDVDCNASYSCFPLRTGGKRPHLGICRTKYALPVLRLDVVSVRQCDCPIGTTCTEMLTDRSTKAKDKVKLFLISFLLSIDRGGITLQFMWLKMVKRALGSKQNSNIARFVNLKTLAQHVRNKKIVC